MTSCSPTACPLLISPPDFNPLQEYLHVCNTPTHGSKPLSPSDEWEVTLGTLMLDLQGHATSTKLQLPGLDPGHPLYAQQRSTSPFSASSMSDGLSSARADILAILPAISMESYVVAYPHVVRLHMLQVGNIMLGLGLLSMSNGHRLEPETPTVMDS